MVSRRAFCTFAALALATATAANGAELKPLAAASITLGEVSGVAYYTVESDGYRVVATVSARPDTTPIRFVATLIVGQSVTLAIPGPVGAPGPMLTIARVDGAVRISGERADGSVSLPERTASSESSEGQPNIR
jgi:hypothetical protein